MQRVVRRILAQRHLVETFVLFGGAPARERERTRAEQSARLSIGSGQKQPEAFRDWSSHDGTYGLRAIIKGEGFSSGYVHVHEEMNGRATEGGIGR
jgi:hypothetical protein